MKSETKYPHPVNAHKRKMTQGVSSTVSTGLRLGAEKIHGGGGRRFLRSQKGNFAAIFSLKCGVKMPFLVIVGLIWSVLTCVSPLMAWDHQSGTAILSIKHQIRKNMTDKKNEKTPAKLEKTSSPRNKVTTFKKKPVLLNKDENNSIFKLIVFFRKTDKETGELEEFRKTFYSFDLQEERQIMETKEMRDVWRKTFHKTGSKAFIGFNGFKKMMEFVEKVHKNGELKMAILYTNIIYEQQSSGSFMPMEILRASPQENLNDDEQE